MKRGLAGALCAHHRAMPLAVQLSVGRRAGRRGSGLMGQCPLSPCRKEGWDAEAHAQDRPAGLLSAKGRSSVPWDPLSGRPPQSQAYGELQKEAFCL